MDNNAVKLKYHFCLTEVISAGSCWLVGRLCAGVFGGLLFLWIFLTMQHIPIMAIIITRNAPPTPPIKTVMSWLSPRKLFLVWALVLDSENEDTR